MSEFIIFIQLHQDILISYAYVDIWKTCKEHSHWKQCSGKHIWFNFYNWKDSARSLMFELKKHISSTELCIFFNIGANPQNTPVTAGRSKTGWSYQNKEKTLETWGLESEI